MPGTNDTGISDARQMPQQALHYLRKSVTYSDFNLESTVAMPAGLPTSAEIMFVKVTITEAFNAGTTNVLTVGSNASSYNDLVDATDVDESATGATIVYRGADVTYSVGKKVYIKYTQSGTAATAGAATVVVVYASNNDQ